jgi:hypothetical protein
MRLLTTYVSPVKHLDTDQYTSKVLRSLTAVHRNKQMHRYALTIIVPASPNSIIADLLETAYNLTRQGIKLESK